ncbi:MAG: phosphomannose isomerase type II C-terminal cupin domain [Proteobacteria bacterium]|nr:phosphomannose isomerase type II C-terminal cupin domain [Pseudomonadota bacterium]
MKEEKRSERPWGLWELLFAGDGFKVKRIIVKPGQRLSLQSHEKRAEHWTVVRGEATIVIGDKKEEVHYNQSRYIEKKQKHRLENHTKADVEIIEVQCGEYLGEDDITRYSDDYNRK